MPTTAELQGQLREARAERDAARHEAQQWKNQHDAAQQELLATTRKLRALEAAAEPYRDGDKRLDEAFKLSNLG